MSDSNGPDSVRMLLLAIVLGGYMQLVRLFLEWPNASFFVRAIGRLGVGFGVAGLVYLAAIEAGVHDHVPAVMISAALAGWQGERALRIVAARWFATWQREGK
jgi:hypothetical protein